MNRFWLGYGLGLMLAGACPADDWPQWMGPNRDGVWRETGIVDSFPADGPTVRWRAPVALGFAGPAVLDGKVVVADYLRTSGDISNHPSKRDALTGRERIQCFDAVTGKRLWIHEDARSYLLSYPTGPRCTPTLADGKAYVLGAMGHLSCLRLEDGTVVWQRDLAADYDTAVPEWGFAAHPLVDGDLVYCLAGGDGSVAVAFDKNTGQERWRALTADEPGYCPPSIIEYGGRRQLLIWHPDSLNSLDPVTGSVFWSVPLKPDFRMSIAMPRFADGFLFAGGIRSTAAWIRLADDRPAAEVVWRGKPKTALYCATSSPFIDGNTLYGSDASGELIAVDTADGARLWSTAAPTSGGDPVGNGTVFLIRHEDRWFLFSETGDLIIARLSPQGYDELDRCPILEPTLKLRERLGVWSHPAFAQRCLFARNDQELVCVDLARTPDRP